MVTVDENRGNGIISFYGTSEDEKPNSYRNQDVAQGSSFFEIDTASFYIFNGDSKQWTKI